MLFCLLYLFVSYVILAVLSIVSICLVCDSSIVATFASIQAGRFAFRLSYIRFVSLFVVVFV